MSRHVLAINSESDKEKRYNARYVTGGYSNIMKEYLIQAAQNIPCVFVHIVLVVAKNKCFRIRVVGVKLAYLQTGRPLIGIMFITNPVPGLEKFSDEFLRLLKPINGLADSGDE